MKDILENEENEKYEKSRRNPESDPKVKSVKRQLFASTGGITCNVSILKKPSPGGITEDREITEDILIICGQFGRNGKLWLRGTHCIPIVY